jgi:autotransporter-associated beta strand protein
LFFNGATAGSATININAGFVEFLNNSMAGMATINNGGSGTIIFTDSSTGGNPTINNNNLVDFFGTSTGGNAAITNEIASAVVDFSGSTNPNLSVGSLAGPGSFVLGPRPLTVGSNNLSTEVSGVISGAGGSLIKVGTGTLTLTGANTYTGDTAINGGILVRCARLDRGLDPDQREQRRHGRQPGCQQRRHLCSR